MNNQKKINMRMIEQDYKRLTRKARKLKGIGNNMKQIAFMANATASSTRTHTLRK